MRVLLSMVLALPLVAGAVGKPDFSGDWKLNVARSDFGKSAAPAWMTSHIEQRGSRIEVHSEVGGPQGRYSTDYVWITDGRENVNTVRGNEIRAMVEWKDQVLIANSKTLARGVALTLVDRWALSADGHTLTITRSISAPQGTAEQTYVYEK